MTMCLPGEYTPREFALASAIESEIVSALCCLDEGDLGHLKQHLKNAIELKHVLQEQCSAYRHALVAIKQSLMAESTDSGVIWNALNNLDQPL